MSCFHIQLLLCWVWLYVTRLIEYLAIWRCYVKPHHTKQWLRSHRWEDLLDRTECAIKLITLLCCLSSRRRWTAAENTSHSPVTPLNKTVHDVRGLHHISAMSRGRHVDHYESTNHNNQKQVNNGEGRESSCFVTMVFLIYLYSLGWWIEERWWEVISNEGPMIMVNYFEVYFHVPVKSLKNDKIYN